MRKLLIYLVVAAVFVPALAWAAEDALYGTSRRAHKQLNLKVVAGEIASLTSEEVIVSTGKEGESAQAKVLLPQRNRQEFSDLLGKGLGKKAQLLCHKTPTGQWQLLRIKSIQDVDISNQPAAKPWIREKLRDRAGQFTPEQRQAMKTLHERIQNDPELREDMQKLRKEDPEAFRKKLHGLFGEAGLNPEDFPPMRPKPGTLGGRSVHGPACKCPSCGLRGPMKMDMSRRDAHPSMPGVGRRQQNPQIQKLERQSYKLAQQYRQAQGKDKQELAEKLKAKLAEAFELKTQAHQKEIERLEKQIQQLHQRLDKRRNNSQAIIEKRFEKLTSQEDGNLRW